MPAWRVVALGMINEDSLQKRNAAILPHLDERERRLFAAAEAKAADMAASRRCRAPRGSPRARSGAA